MERQKSDAAQKHIQDFLLDLRRSGKRYNFGNRQDLENFCQDCILYFESVGLNGVSVPHVLHIIETTVSLAQDPIIRDAKAVLGGANQVNGVVQLPGKPRSKYLVDPSTVPKGEQAPSAPPGPPPPDVASVAFAGTTGDTEAGPFNAIDLLFEPRQRRANSPEHARGISGWFGFGKSYLYDEGEGLEGAHTGGGGGGEYYDFEGAGDAQEEEDFRRYAEYLDGEVRRVQETMRSFLAETVRTRSYRSQSAVGFGPAGPWYSLCSVTYAADVHEQVISWTREVYAEHAPSRRRKAPYCEDVLVYMAEGPVFGTVFVFRFDEEPNPEPVEVEGPAGVSQGAAVAGKSYAEIACHPANASHKPSAMPVGEFSQAQKFD